MHELDTKKYIFTRRRKLVDLSKDKIAAALDKKNRLLADGFGNPMDGVMVCTVMKA